MTANAEYRSATPEDAPELAQLWRGAFNAPAEFVESLPQRLRPERVLVASVDGRIAATAQGFGIHQWFGGRPVPMIGVASVATHPLHRGTGLGTDVVARLLTRAAEDGHVLSTLYPATVPVYRRLGYEYAGIYLTYRVPLMALPSGPQPDLIEIPQDGGPARASHERLAVRENGLTAGVDDDWWPARVLHKWSRGSTGGVMTGEEIPDGYAAYEHLSLPD
ncbi:MAG TPA: GNAT family N-acetyltransferase, partial [Actinomycetota bacterium]|nr:GNAT family N-acetyltransferase [Actinomycetota bacterium]